MSPPARSRSKAASGSRLTAGEHLRAEMLRLGLNQVTLGKALGVTRQTVNNVINGRRPISRGMSAALARLTDRPVDYWLQNSFATGSSTFSQGVLPKDQILHAIEQGAIGIAPFEKKRLRAVSIELTFGGSHVDLVRRPKTSGTLRLKRGQSAIVWTRERITLSPGHVARIGVVPEFARAGLAAFNQLQFEPGFSGQVCVTLFNAGPAELLLRPGDPVFALEIVAFAGPSVRS